MNVFTETFHKFYQKKNELTFHGRNKIFNLNKIASFECNNKLVLTIKYIKRVSTRADFTVLWLSKILVLSYGTVLCSYSEKKILLIVTFEVYPYRRRFLWASLKNCYSRLIMLFLEIYLPRFKVSPYQQKALNLLKRIQGKVLKKVSSYLI